MQLTPAQAHQQPKTQIGRGLVVQKVRDDRQMVQPVVPGTLWPSGNERKPILVLGSMECTKPSCYTMLLGFCSSTGQTMQHRGQRVVACETDLSLAFSSCLVPGKPSAYLSV